MKKLLVIPGLLLAVVLHAAAQKIDSALNVLVTQHPSEKIYIHYDKEYYVTGETIWFKAYLYSDGKPSGMSTNLFLQFITVFVTPRFEKSGGQFCQSLFKTLAETPCHGTLFLLTFFGVTIQPNFTAVI